MYNFSSSISIKIKGGSHEKSISAKVKGLPVGFVVDKSKLSDFLKRRAPGRDFTTQRKESDDVIFKKGVDENGKIVDKTIEYKILNNDVRKKDYQNQKSILRPSHADLGEYFKTNKAPEYTGGGRFSGRMTALMAVLGGICKQILEDQSIHVYGRLLSVGKVLDQKNDYANIDEKLFEDIERKKIPMISDKMARLAEEEILSLNGDSIGAVVEIVVLNFPAGYGDAMFQGVDGMIARGIFGVPAVKGVEFGNGFLSSSLKGSQNNDAIYINENKEIKTKTNNAGGILGGITNGMPIVIKVAIKPTPSIYLEQDSVDVETMQNVKLNIKGRHDPCIGIRAVSVFEGIVATVLADLLLSKKE